MKKSIQLYEDKSQYKITLSASADKVAGLSRLRNVTRTVICRKAEPTGRGHPISPTNVNYTFNKSSWW